MIFLLWNQKQNWEECSASLTLSHCHQGLYRACVAGYQGVETDPALSAWAPFSMEFRSCHGTGPSDSLHLLISLSRLFHIDTFNRFSQLCPISLPNMPGHELQQKNRPGFRLNSLLQEEACSWQWFPNPVHTTKQSWFVCIGCLSRTTSHPLTWLLLQPAAEAASSMGSSPGCKPDRVSPVPSSQTSCVPFQGFSYARHSMSCTIVCTQYTLPHCNPEARGPVTPRAIPWPIDDRWWIHSSLFLSTRQAFLRCNS